jgi:hypothetical protein
MISTVNTVLPLCANPDTINSSEGASPLVCVYTAFWVFGEVDVVVYFVVEWAVFADAFFFEQVYAFHYSFFQVVSH